MIFGTCIRISFRKKFVGPCSGESGRQQVPEKQQMPVTVIIGKKLPRQNACNVCKNVSFNLT
jgi:hypothetical protein